MNHSGARCSEDGLRVHRRRPFTSMASLVILGFTLATAAGQSPAVAVAGTEAVSARNLAQTYIENDEDRKALAVLAEAARADPADRVIGAMLYGMIRDHVWHLPQTLPIAHDAPVHALTFSPDGTLLASGAESGLVVIASTEPLDEEEAKARRIEFKQQGQILGVLFSPDGQRLAVASAIDGLKIWNLQTRAVVFEGPKPASPATAFRDDRKGQLVAIGTDEGTIQVWDVAAGRILSQPDGAKAKVVDLAFSPDGGRIGAALGDQTARVWEAMTGRAIGEPIRVSGAITSVDFSIDNRALLIAGSNKQAVLIDPESGVAAVPAISCVAAIKKARISPDGAYVATMLDDGSVKFWDALTAKELPFDVREDGQFNDFSWSRTGLRMVTASENNRASLWGMRDGARWGEWLPLDSPAVTVAYSLDGVLLATACRDGKVHIWRNDGGKAMPTVRTHSARARSAFYSLDGEHLVTTSEDHTAIHWVTGGVRPAGILKHKGKVNCATFNSDATRILTCDDTGIAQLWNTETGKPEGAPFLHKGPVTWVDFHPDGTRFLSTSGGSAFVWNVAERAKPVAIITHAGSGKSVLKCARFSPNGKWLATASTDGTARIWDAATFKAATAPIKRGFPVLCVRFSPDSSRLVVGGEDAQAVVYDTATWKAVGRPVQLPGAVFSAAITADNLFLVGTSFLLNAVQFFEIETGRPLGLGPEIPAQATCVDYHLPDKVAIVACDDGTVRAFGSSFVSQDVPPWACAFAERLALFRKTGPDVFERLDSHVGQLNNYASKEAVAINADFARLVNWKMTMGTGRTGMPRFVSTIAANIDKRVEERSINALYECYDAAPVDPLVLAALSRYLTNGRQCEFLADLVAHNKKAEPLALALAAGTLANAGRREDAQKVMDQAVAAAPNDPKVLRREAKLNARWMNKDLAIQQFERVLALEPNDLETRRAYGWALYNLNEPEKAAAQFRLAQDLVGDFNADLVAGLCVCAAAIHKTAEATTAFRRLVEIDASWKDESYIASLAGWTRTELDELEAIRGRLYSKRR